MGDSTFNVYCPVCNLLVQATVIANGSDEVRSEAINPIDQEDARYETEFYSVCLCLKCKQPFLIRESILGVPGEFEVANDETVLYPVVSNAIPAMLPESVKSAYDQAARSLNASLFDPCVIMSGKCLEAVCKTLGIQGNNLSIRLKNLSEAGHIDSRLLDWAHEIRLIRNEAAHNVDSPTTKQDAQDILDFTEAILIYIFSLTKRFDSLKARRAKLDNSEKNQKD